MDREGNNPADEPINKSGPPEGFTGIWVRPLSEGVSLEVEYADGWPNGRVRVWYHDLRSVMEAEVLPRMTTRRWMVAVTVTGLMLGWVAHAQRVMREDDEYGGAVVMVELLTAGLLLPIVLAIARLLRKEADHIARLRRSEVPVSLPWLTSDDESDPPGPE